MSNEHRNHCSPLDHFGEDTMQAPWHEGDISSGYCYKCRKPVTTRFESRTIQLAGSRVSFPNILVGVCTDCNETVDMARQSLEQFRELSSWK
jgi:hypothetical protein